LEYNDKERESSVKENISSDSVPFPIDVQLVVEFYAKSI
jgi:hypothetical protein